MFRRRFFVPLALAALVGALFLGKIADGARPVVSDPDPSRIPGAERIVKSGGGSDGDQQTQYRWPRVELFPAEGVNPSNYDATAITAIQGVKINDLVPVVGSKFAPGSPDNQWARIDVSLTITTDVGDWDVHTPTSWGMDSLQTATVSLSGSSDYLYDRFGDINLVQPPHFEGAINIAYEFRDTVVTVDGDGRVLSVGSEARPAEIFRTSSRPYDDGSYEATLQNMKVLRLVEPAP